jgi:type 1 fimbria pilin
MKNLIFLSIGAVAALWLSGCATADKIHTPDGRTGYSISCNGTVQDWGSCYEKAGDICGSRGYDVLDKSAKDTELSSFLVYEAS